MRDCFCGEISDEEGRQMQLLVHIYVLPWYKLMLFIPAMLVLYTLAVIILRKAGVRSGAFWAISILLWMILVFLATLHRQSAETTSDSFQPLFQSYINARTNPEMYRLNFLNIVLFFPGGLFLWSMLPDRWIRAVRIIISALFFAGMSFAIELAQLYFHLGLAEMDDVMHNTIGGLLGAAGAMVITALLRKKKSRTK